MRFFMTIFQKKRKILGLSSIVWMFIFLLFSPSLYAGEVVINVTPVGGKISIEEGKELEIKVDIIKPGGSVNCDVEVGSTVTNMLNGFSSQDLVVRKFGPFTPTSDGETGTIVLFATDNDGVDPNESVRYTVTPAISGNLPDETPCAFSTDTPSTFNFDISVIDTAPALRPKVKVELSDVIISSDQTSAELPITLIQTPAGSNINCNAKIELTPSNLGDLATINQTNFTQSGKANISVNARDLNDKVFDIQAKLTVNEALCDKEEVTSAKITIKAKNEVKVTNEVTVKLSPSTSDFSIREGNELKIRVNIIKPGDTKNCVVDVGSTTIKRLNGLVAKDLIIRSFGPFAPITNSTTNGETGLLILYAPDNDGTDPNESGQYSATPAISGVLPDGSPCVFSDATPSKFLFNINVIDTEPTVAPIGSKKEPENILKLTCNALRQKEKLSTTQTSYFIAQCGDGENVGRNFEPEEVSVQSTAILHAAGRQLQNIHSRLKTIQATKGGRGVDVSGATLNIQGTKVSVGLLGGAAGDDDNTLLENSRWGFFANGDYAFGDEDRGNDTTIATGGRNFDFNSAGLTFGTDYRFSGNKKYAGIALGYKDFNSDFTSQAGGSDVKGYNLNLYGTYLLSDKAYLDATMGYGKDKITSTRPVNNDGTGPKTTFATGKPNANELTFSIGGGYQFYKGEWSLTPYSRMDYTKGTINAYKETSHQSANSGLFSFDEQNVNALTSTLGVKTSRTISTSKGVFIPYTSLEWKHEFKEKEAITGSHIDPLTGKPISIIEGSSSDLDRNYYTLGAGISAQFPKGKSAFLSLESRQGDLVVKENAVRAGFRWEF